MLSSRIRCRRGGSGVGKTTVGEETLFVRGHCYHPPGEDIKPKKEKKRSKSEEKLRGTCHEVRPTRSSPSPTRRNHALERYTTGSRVSPLFWVQAATFTFSFTNCPFWGGLSATRLTLVAYTRRQWWNDVWGVASPPKFNESRY